MDRETKIVFGKILAEIYRTQRKVDPSTSPDDERIYGLINGIEDSINREFDATNFIEDKVLNSVIKVLAGYGRSQSLPERQSFLHVQENLSAEGVIPSDARVCMKYLYAQGIHSMEIAQLAQEPGSRYQDIHIHDHEL